MNERQVKKLGWVIIAIPFVMGFIGFMIAYGKDYYIPDSADPFSIRRDYAVEHALFDAFGQYFFNRDKGGHMNWLITISQFMAPIFMICGVLLIGGYARRLADLLLCIMPGETIAVYGDHKEAQSIELGKEARGRSIIYRKDRVVKRANCHIVFFKDDRRSLQFLEENEKLFRIKKGEPGKHKPLYVIFNETDPFLMSDDKKFSDVHLVNINEIISKKFWKEYDLLHLKKDGCMEADVAIIGFGDLGKKLLHYGIVLNCYDTAQAIRYHVWGDTKLFESSLPADDSLTSLNDCINDENMMDSICYEGTDFTGRIREICKMDRIILADGCNAELIQTVIRGCPEKEVFFLDPEGESLAGYYGENIRSYGARDSYDVEEILRETEHRTAKALNADYAKNHPSDDNRGKSEDELWLELNPFTKESNDITADYHVIREKILAHALLDRSEPEREEISEEDWINHQVDEMIRLEHTRWCRFHYMNGWKLTKPKPNGDRRKISNKRLHSLLVPFEELREKEKTKDVENVVFLLRTSQTDNKDLENKLCQITGALDLLGGSVSDTGEKGAHKS